MSFRKESDTTMPIRWLSENVYGSSFARLDMPDGSIHPEVAVGSSRAITASIEPGSVYRGLGFGHDPPVSNEFSANIEFLNDFHFPSVAGEDGPFMSEDTVMANSFSWDIGMDFGNPYHRGEFKDTIENTGQDRIFDIAIPSDKLRHQTESPTLQRPIGDHPGSDEFQPLLQARHEYRDPSSKSEAWKQNLKSSPDTAKSSNHLSKSDSPLSERQREDAYFQLGFFYRFKPHPTKQQLEALAIVVELPYDEVRAFYRQKKSQPTSILAHSLQFRHGQGSRISRSAKRVRGSDTSSSPEPVRSAYGPSRSDSSASLQTSERSAIARTPSLNRQVREISQKTYECTWRGCSMSFASKSDWKRHEEVHCPQWEWTCIFQSQSTEKCSKAIPCTRPPFKRSDHLREHLRKDHNCVDASKVESGRQCIIPQSPFDRQCGFCGHMTLSWLDRIDHIAEHFKNGKTMSEWTDIWPENSLEEESDPSDDDDNDDKDDESSNGEANGMDNNNNNNNPTSQHQNHAGNGSGSDNSNKNPPTGSYHSGNGYRRPGTFVFRYRAPSHGTDFSGSLQRRDKGSLRRELDSCCAFWSKMRNILKDRNSQKDTFSAPSLQATKTASFEASRDIVRKDEERIEFYCILCTRRVSTEPPPPNMDEYYCICSEAAIKEHIMSVALAGLHLETPSTKRFGEGTRLEHQTQNREKTPSRLAVASRERGLASTKPQCPVAFEQVGEQLSHSVKRLVKTGPASEHLIELNQDENSWVEVHSLDLAGSNSKENAESLFSTSKQETSVRSKSGKLCQIRGSDRVLHSMKSFPELRWPRTHRDR